MKKITILALSTLTFTSAVCAHDWTTSRADSHAPISVMGDHTHNQGEWMFSYRYMHMTMSGLQQGNHSISTDTVLEDYMMAPLDMDMDMHMIGAMYAPNNRITFMAMLNYLENSMNMIDHMGMRSRSASKGLGDSKLSALINLKNWGQHKLHANFGISIPTGSINPRYDTAMGEDTLLPYGMRLGSGTYDFNVGLTWNYQAEQFSMGAQIMNTTRTGENDADYRLGHENKFTYWLGVPFGSSWSLGASLVAKNVQSIKGMDHRLMHHNHHAKMMHHGPMSPTINADFSGGDFVHLGLGLNYLSHHDNWTRGHRLALEYSVPVIQDVAGIQMKQDAVLTLGWQKSF
ncbi:MAG: transporter [Marinicella pacifica]